MRAGPGPWQATRWLADPAFRIAAAAGPVTALAMAPWLPDEGQRDALALLSFTVFQPLAEEYLFRGLLQPWLARHLGARRCVGPVTAANLLTSALFASAHLLSHAPWWAASVLLPSLVFGFFRERHGHVGPAVALHMHYNTCYLIASL